MTRSLSVVLNACGLLALTAVLAVAFGYQFALGELPCPLCLLQRAAFAAAGVGLALNVCLGPRPSHYAMTILSAVAGAGVAARQVLLHITPGSGSYGSPFLGIHFYSWALMLFVAIVVGSAAMLLADRQFAAEGPGTPAAPALGKGAVALFLFLVAANGISTFAECGGGMCPDNPTEYQLLSR
ncbi:disulfide bond formation protein B [Hansschlegelia zhihuaiae]|uniref:Disulfide bond formation protein B n=1 Tax=Hansschlegelia zhihuaiae TaxID=405005 RepID=A0A4V1KJI8_9HYPH|nr:disulfide bond formation protein B [Hansschlegelia zhihuaiae]RXF74342.1 disulfide bond formation protein B [Hansschlegelia zhihuaiae]